MRKIARVKDQPFANHIQQLIVEHELIVTTAAEMAWRERLKPGTPTKIKRSSGRECSERGTERVFVIVDHFFRDDRYNLGS